MIIPARHDCWPTSRRMSYTSPMAASTLSSRASRRWSMLPAKLPGAEVGPWFPPSAGKNPEAFCAWPYVPNLVAGAIAQACVFGTFSPDQPLRIARAFDFLDASPARGHRKQGFVEPSKKSCYGADGSSRSIRTNLSARNTQGPIACGRVCIRRVIETTSRECGAVAERIRAPRRRHGSDDQRHRIGQACAAIPPRGGLGARAPFDGSRSRNVHGRNGARVITRSSAAIGGASPFSLSGAP